MIDLHTHILPGMDDGARDAAESLVMLRMMAAQGVHTVALTPHFCSRREGQTQFLARRRAAYETLREAIHTLSAEEQAALPRLILGAEVAWMPGISRWEELPRLCYDGTRTMLLELPFSPWGSGLIRELYDLMSRTGITPVIAHLERYRKIATVRQLEELLSLGLPAQLGTEELLSPLYRRRALQALDDWAYLIASDCHRSDHRRPNLAAAMDVVRRKRGEVAAAALIAHAGTLIEPLR